MASSFRQLKEDEEQSWTAAGNRGLSSGRQSNYKYLFKCIWWMRAMVPGIETEELIN